MERSGTIRGGGTAAREAAAMQPATQRRLPSASRVLYLLALALVMFVVLAEALQVNTWWGEFGAVFSGRRGLRDGTDFACFYSAAKLVFRGDGAQILDPNALYAIQHANALIPDGHVLPYLNPPFLAGLMAPLAWLSFGHAYQAWSVLSLALLGVCCWQIWQLTDALRRPWRAVAILAFITVYPLTYALRQGQFSLWLVAGFGGVYNSLRTGHERSAGAWLSLLLLKPELLLPIAALLAWKRRFIVFSTLLPILLVCVIASVAVVGPWEALRYPLYLRDISVQHVSGTFTPEMFGWTGLVGASIGAAHPRIALAIHTPLALAGLAAVALLWRGPWRVDDEHFSSRWFALILATVLADPHLYLQDTIVLAPAAIAWVSTERSAGRAGQVLVVLLGWAILGLGNSPNVGWHVNAFAIAMAVTAATLVVGGLPTSRAHEERAAESPVLLARSA